MSEWDWLVENGWADSDGINYDAVVGRDRTRVSGRQRWDTRQKRVSQSIHRNDYPNMDIRANPEALEAARQLVETRQKLDQLREQERLLKLKFANLTKHGNWTSVTSQYGNVKDTYLVENLVQRRPPALSTVKATKYIKGRFGSKELSLFIEACANYYEPKAQIYLRKQQSVLVAEAEPAANHSVDPIDDDIPF